MPWVKLDDQFFAHPKVIDLSKDAKLLYLAGLAYCAAQITDGAISTGALRMVAGQVDVERGISRELVAAGLWTVTDTGYFVHDYLDYNPSAEQVKAERAKTAQRVAKWREQQAAGVVSNAVTNTVTNADVTPPVRPPRTPSRSHTNTPERESTRADADARTRTRANDAAVEAASLSLSLQASASPEPEQTVTQAMPAVSDAALKEQATHDALFKAFTDVVHPPSKGEQAWWTRYVGELVVEKMTPEEVPKAYHAWRAARDPLPFNPKVCYNHLGELRGSYAHQRRSGNGQSAPVQADAAARAARVAAFEAAGIPLPANHPSRRAVNGATGSG